MENEYLFDYAEKAMVEAVKGVAEGFKGAVQETEFTDLFHIAKKDLIILKAADSFAQKYVVDICADLIFQLLSNYEIGIKTEALPACVDFAIETELGLMGYSVSYSFQHIFDVQALKESGLCGLTVIVLQDVLTDDYTVLKPNSKIYKESGSEGFVNNVLLSKFLGDMEINEYKNFKLYADKYELDVQEAVGISTAIVPTDKALTKCKDKVEEELLNWEYLSELGEEFADYIDTLKENVKKNSKIITGNNDFAKSVLSSEWYYDLQVKTDRGLDQTAIVAGYLKSVEQFLVSLIKARSKSWKVYVEHKKWKEENGDKKWVPFNEQYIKNYNLTFGAINKCLADDRNMFFNKDKDMKVYITGFLEQYCIHIRNGLFHKDNLYTWGDIKNIRNKTYCVYFLLLGDLFINNDLRNMLINKNEYPDIEEEGLDYDSFATWLTELMHYSNDIGYKYFYFKLSPGYNTGRHSLLICGANEYSNNDRVFDSENERPKIVRRFFHTPYVWNSKTSVSGLREAAAEVILKYLSEGEHASLLKKYDAIMVGNFGDIDIIYKK